MEFEFSNFCFYALLSAIDFQNFVYFSKYLKQARWTNTNRRMAGLILERTLP